MAWHYDCPRHLSTLYIAETSYNKILGNFVEAAMDVDQINRRTFDYSNQIPFENNP